MTRSFRIALVLLLPLSAAAENCDLTHFRWLCEEPVQVTPVHPLRSIVNCNGTPVYVSRAQYETLMRHQRAGVNMTLNVNGEYVTSPCVPAGY